jgi:flagellar hook-associated protein 1 FlgK
MSRVPLAAANSFFSERGYSVNMVGVPGAGDTFDVSAANNAAINMSLTTTVKNDTNKIAAGSTTMQGDGGVAQNISSLQSQKTIGGAWAPNGSQGVYSYTDFYGATVSAVGTSTKAATENVSLFQSVSTQISNMKSQISGVNMDEEMVSLVKFQNGYQASAKTISTVNQMLQSLMSII